MKLTFSAILLMCLFGIAVSDLFAADKIGERLSHVLSISTSDEPVVAWVYFRDKGIHESMKFAIPRSLVSERSIQRRLKVRAEREIMDYADLPLDPNYVAQVGARVMQVRQRSKWFNSVSITATKMQIADVGQLACVSNIDLVARFRKGPDRELETSSLDEPNQAVPQGGNSINALNYGSSAAQVTQINVPAVHNTGNYGQGVVVGVFDNGFRLLTHEAFDTLQARIIATYDFVDHKVSVVPNDPSTGTGAHGVNTLSTIGGYKPGQLIGPAFGATYILARTENDSSETPFEEDNWAAAIEWADSIGVDVTSTSLGYLTYDAPYPSWTWQDMNGSATLITRAADMAVGRGIVVVNSAGNDGQNASHNTLGAPADGDSVLTVGAVTSTGTISSFSSVGPTTSIPPRIKPDVMARGSSVRVASAITTTAYGTASGTSFSCPLAAGVAALIVHAHPTASPVAVMNAMRSTASNSVSPNNQYGWGILNAMAAINSLGVLATATTDTGTNIGSTSASLNATVNPNGTATTVIFEWGATTAYGNTTSLQNIGSGTSPLQVNASIAGLSPSSLYHFRVSATNGGGTTNGSDRSFTTRLAAPAPPTLLQPANGSPNLNITLVLRWHSSTLSSSYLLQLATDSLFSSLVVNDSTVTDTVFQVGSLAYSTAYYWRVRAANTDSASAFSIAWNFTTIVAVPVSPTLVSPLNNETDLPLVSTLVWNSLAGTVTYRVQISADSIFGTLVFDDSTLTDSTRQSPPLSNGSIYWWRVRAKNIGGIGPWSLLHRFTTTSDVTRAYVVVEGWNMLSVALNESDPRKIQVYPTATSNAFSFALPSGYSSVDTLLNGGGFWLKFGSLQTVNLTGGLLTEDTVDIVSGWNLIGSLSDSVATESIIQIPVGIVESPYYGYSAEGYSPRTAIQPGQGYWVKSQAPGKLVLRLGDRVMLQRVELGRRPLSPSNDEKHIK